MVTEVQDRRRQRSEKTRRRLLVCAAHEFALGGFAATTTRMLADAAGVNQAAIQYHFGGKEGLYFAVAEQIAARGREAMRLQLPSITARGGSLTPIEAQIAIGVLLRGLLAGFVTIAGDGSAAAFIVREQANPGPAFDLVYNAYIRPVHAHMTALVATATERSERDPEAILAAHAFIGMALGFVTARETVLRRTRWKKYTAKRLEQVTEVVVALAQAALASPPRGARAPKTARRA
jgi:AcrR family transcriptional regulator